MTLPDFKGPVILDIPADPLAMFIVRALVDKISAKIGFEPRQTDKLVLAVDEACTNVIRYAYKSAGDERIVITFSIGPDCFEISIRDFGSGADPQTFQGRDLNDIRPGGLGTHFIKSAVDRFEYDTPPGGGMLLKLTKFLPAEEKAQN
ncbi:MAG TPA: ATP-binding protein [Syntrophobacteraceae bacterium]|nr:ATP-binding protein [Syntrophobacteraceae bacterium]